MNVQQIHHNPSNAENTDDYFDGSQPKSLSHANNVSSNEQQSVITLTTSTSTSILASTSTSSIPNTQRKTASTITTTTTFDSQSSKSRMSMFFFRLHNLQREQENKRKKSAQQQRQRQRRGAKVFRSDSDTGHLTLAPSRLFEKTPIKPSDSLDEIALQIPRYFHHIFGGQIFHLEMKKESFQ